MAFHRSCVRRDFRASSPARSGSRICFVSHGKTSAGRSAEADHRTIVQFHALLLGAIAASIFLWVATWGDTIMATALAVMASLNPHTLALANVVSYHLLFLTLLLFSTLRLLSLRRSASAGLPAAGAGVLLGLASLVRPVTLALPVLIVPLLLLRGPTPGRVKSAILIVLGMALVIGPYVGRNYLVTGQPIVTAQSGFAFWGTSVEKMQPGDPFLVWQPIWFKYGMPVFAKVTGSATYSGLLLNAHAVELNGEFAKEARQNIAASPGIYLHNIVRNFISFNLDTMDFWTKYLGARNKGLVGVFSKLWIVSLMVFAAAGIVAGVPSAMRTASWWRRFILESSFRISFRSRPTLYGCEAAACPVGVRIARATVSDGIRHRNSPRSFAGVRRGRAGRPDFKPCVVLK